MASLKIGVSSTCDFPKQHASAQLYRPNPSFSGVYVSTASVGLLTPRPLKYRTCAQDSTSKKRGVLNDGRNGSENSMSEPLRPPTKNDIVKNRGFVSTRCDKVQSHHAGALKKEAEIPARVTTTKNASRSPILLLSKSDGLCRKPYFCLVKMRVLRSRGLNNNIY